ncbi:MULTISPECIES: hypothetical protein [unclassified Methylobacterium]|uniref:hypothetical protein n=1 Tax=unclassified Methylobacterium TaxID=2615210 RepID=UPI0003103FE0|nr:MULTISPECIES: hypothetical protein [Methylobacterium]WFT81881.1 hypothetical protein QA634_08490 [Methylobacterium nodulans]
MLMALLGRLARAWHAPAQAWRATVAALTDPYRPELHYMRGPGPRWHARHRPR